MVRVRWIDSLRGLAAMSVAWFHLYSQNGGALIVAPGVVDHAAIVGRYGVELFFVISGFVLVFSLLPRRDLLTAQDVGRYFVRRSVRLDPPYFAALLLYLALFPAFAAAEGAAIDPAVSPQRLFFSIFYFLPHTGELYMPVAWTLAIEVQFYLFVAVLIVLINRLGQTLTPWIMAAVVALGALPRLGLFHSLDVGFWLLPHLSTFAVGMTAALIALRQPGARRLFAASLVVVAYGAATAGGRSLAALLFGLVLIACLASPRVRKVLENPILLFLGAISYCVYLLHQLVGSLVIEALQRRFDQPGPAQILVVAIGVAATVLAGYLLHRVVERPSIAWSKRIAFGRRRPAPVPAADLA